MTPHHADTYISRANYNSALKVQDGTTENIMEVVLDCFVNKNGQVKRFAPSLKAATQKETCNNVWKFLKKNVRYKEDPPGEQWIKEPARVWADKVCDCKSYSVFAASCLYHLGLQPVFRFVSFTRDKTPTHVYIIVNAGNKEIIIDCVLPGFNQEKPYTHKYDYEMTQISQLSGVTLPTVMPKPLTATVEAPKKDVFGLLANTAAGFIPGGTGIKNLISLAASVNISPGFFSTLPFLKFLDNSTGQWKSTYAHVKNLTPVERILFYMERMTRGEDCTKTAIQYSELFGASRKPENSSINDVGSIPVAVLEEFNRMANELYFKGSDTMQCGKWPYPKSYVLQDLRTAPDFGYTPQPTPKGDLPGPDGEPGKDNTLLYLGGAALLAKLLLF